MYNCKLINQSESVHIVSASKAGREEANLGTTTALHMLKLLSDWCDDQRMWRGVGGGGGGGLKISKVAGSVTACGALVEQSTWLSQSSSPVQYSSPVVQSSEWIHTPKMCNTCIHSTIPPFHYSTIPLFPFR